MLREPKRIEIAPRTRIAAVEPLAPRFFREVLGYEYEECLTTDESDLRDYTDWSGDTEAEVAAMLDRFEAHYFVDPRPAKSTLVVDLLEFLEARGVTA